MKTQYLNSILGALLLIALSSCRSESLPTTETAQATMSSSQSDRIYYIERTADKFTGDLILHLGMGEDTPPQKSINTPVIHYEVNGDPAPTHIGPFCIKRARSIKREAWDLEKLILEWIFNTEE